MKSDKTRKFLEILAAQIAKDPIVSRKPKRLKREFHVLATGLKDGKLKQRILNNFDDCFADLQNIIQEQLSNATCKKQKPEKARTNKNQHSTVPLENGHSQKKTKFVYNLYCKKGIVIDEEQLKKMDKSTQCSLYCSYLRCVLPELEDEERLLDIASKCKIYSGDGHESWIEDLTKLCTCLHGDINPHSLKLIMNVFNRKFAEASEATSETKGLLNLITHSQHFIKTFHFHYSTLKKEFEGRPKYEDFLAGILATYIDLCLTVHHSNPEICPVNAKQLCSFVLRLLGDQKHFGYDLILQLEKVQSGCGELILPLARHLLENVPTMTSCAIYVKYVLSARFIAQWMPKETKAIKQKVAAVLPPADFLTWIENNNSSILDELPESKHFKDAKITRFLLDEADDDTVQLLIDLLSEVYGEDVTEANETEETPPNVDADDLFVIDKAPDANAASDMKAQFGSQEEAADDDLLLKVVQVDENASSCSEAELDSNDYTESESEPIQVNNIMFEVLTKEEAATLSLVEKTEKALGHITNFGMEMDSGEQLGMMSNDEEEILSSDDELDVQSGDEECEEVLSSDVEQGIVQGSSDEIEEILSSDMEHEGQVLSSIKAGHIEDKHMFADSSKNDCGNRKEKVVVFCEEAPEGIDEIDLVSDTEQSDDEEGPGIDMEDIEIQIVDQDEEDERIRPNGTKFFSSSQSSPRLLEKTKSDPRNVAVIQKSRFKADTTMIRDNKCVLDSEIEEDQMDGRILRSPAKSTNQEVINFSLTKSPVKSLSPTSLRSNVQVSPRRSSVKRSSSSAEPGKSPKNMRPGEILKDSKLSDQLPVVCLNAVDQNDVCVENGKKESSPVIKTSVKKSPRNQQVVKTPSNVLNRSLDGTDVLAVKSPVNNKDIENSKISPKKRQVMAESIPCGLHRSLHVNKAVSASDTSASESSPRKRERVDFSDIDIVNTSPSMTETTRIHRKIRSTTILEFQAETSFQSDASDILSSLSVEQTGRSAPLNHNAAKSSDAEFVTDSSTDRSSDEKSKGNRHKVLINRYPLNFPGMSPRTGSNTPQEKKPHFLRSPKSTDLESPPRGKSALNSPKNTAIKSSPKKGSILHYPKLIDPQSPTEARMLSPSSRNKDAGVVAESKESPTKAKTVPLSPTKAQNVASSPRKVKTDEKSSLSKETQQKKHTLQFPEKSAIDGMDSLSQMPGSVSVRPVSRRLGQLMVEEGSRPQRRKTASGAELAETLKQAQMEEKSLAVTAGSRRRRSMPAPHLDDNNDNEDDSQVVKKTPRKAAVKANELLTSICSPRKRHDSQMSVGSNIDDGDAPFTRTRKRTDSEVSTQSTSDVVRDLPTDVRTPRNKIVISVARKARRASMPVQKMTIIETEPDTADTAKKSPKKALSRRHSLRTPSKRSVDRK